MYDESEISHCVVPNRNQSLNVQAKLMILFAYFTSLLCF